MQNYSHWGSRIDRSKANHTVGGYKILRWLIEYVLMGRLGNRTRARRGVVDNQVLPSDSSGRIEPTPYRDVPRQLDLNCAGISPPNSRLNFKERKVNKKGRGRDVGPSVRRSSSGLHCSIMCNTSFQARRFLVRFGPCNKQKDAKLSICY